MYTFITFLLIVASVFMVLIVLVQNSKGGGLANNFQSSNQVMGVRKTNDFLDKATWALAIIILVLSVAGSAFVPKSNVNVSGTEMSDQIKNAAPSTSAIPTFPTAEQEATNSNQEEVPATAEQE